MICAFNKKCRKEEFKKHSFSRINETKKFPRNDDFTRFLPGNLRRNENSTRQINDHQESNLYGTVQTFILINFCFEKEKIFISK